LDNVIAAIGQFPELPVEMLTYEDQELATTRWNTIDADPDTLQTNIEWVFAGGDVVSGAATVVEAFGTTRKAAYAIHCFLNGESRVSPLKGIRSEMWDEAHEEEVKTIPQMERLKMPDLHIPDREGNFEEVELGLSEIQAKEAAARCLQCGIYCYRRN
jgi:NADPH-dependent glutamate synthase beta subunit-like oxidoreductase